MSKIASPMTLLKFLACLRFPRPCEVNLVWSALSDSKDLAGNDPLLTNGSTNLELGIRHHKQLCRPKVESYAEVSINNMYKQTYYFTYWVFIIFLN